MRAHTSQFKEAISTYGRQLDSKITYTIDDVETELGAEELNSVTPSIEGALLKSVMKSLEIDSNVEIPKGTEINYQFGVFIENEETPEDSDYEYLDFGNYIVYSVEKQEDTNSYKILAYDKMLYSMNPYEEMDFEYPITIREYIIEVCNKLGLVFANANGTFPNYDKLIDNELYLDSENGSLDYTYRDVVDEIAQVTASCVCINDNDALELRYVNNTNDTIDGEFLKDVNVKFGEKYGPINSVVFSRSAESDNIFIRDEESIELNGLCEYRIKDNQILNGNNRDEFLQDIFDELNGLEFYVTDYSSTGIAYYEIYDKYNIEITDEETETTTTYPTLMLNDTINITQGLEENIHTDMPEETNTDYEYASSTDRAISQAYIIAKKQEATIESLVSQTDENTQTIERLTQDIEGVTSQLTKKGGNNLIKNSSLLFEEDREVVVEGEITTMSGYEFWNYNLLLEHPFQKVREENAVTGFALSIPQDYVSQEISLLPGNYYLSFKYKRLNNFAGLTLIVNGEEYSIEFEDGDANEEKIYELSIVLDVRNITLQFISTQPNIVEIYDLMLNVGESASPYSQNANETTTDTVKIGKGIQVEGSNDTITRVDSDGFRVLNKNNQEEVLLRATDVGTETKQLVVKEKATINLLVIQEIDGQVWINSAEN